MLRAQEAVAVLRAGRVLSLAAGCWSSERAAVVPGRCATTERLCHRQWLMAASAARFVCMHRRLQFRLHGNYVRELLRPGAPFPAVSF